MSSRSNGVMNVSLSSRMIAWVTSSPACSAARILSAICLAVGRRRPQQLLEQAGADTRFCPEVANIA